MISPAIHEHRWFAPAALLLAAALACGQAGANPRVPPEPQLTPVKPVTDPEGIAAWLRQLVGGYRVEGMVQIVYAPPPDSEPKYPCISGDRPTDYCMSIKGKGDCVAVGTGPGVQCMLNVAWKDIYEVVQPSDGDTVAGVFSLPGGVSYLDPAMALFGIDPGQSALSYLLVDNKGLPEGGAGHIAGNRATFITPCVNSPALFNEMKPAPRDRQEGPPRTCKRTLRIEIKPDARILHMTMDIAINDELWTRHDLSLYRVSPTTDDAAPAKPAAAR